MLIGDGVGGHGEASGWDGALQGGWNGVADDGVFPGGEP
jgi:hypothetical protein